MDIADYLRIRKDYGHCASWAVWADSEGRPKSNIGDLKIFDESLYPILDVLKPKFVLVGLNLSGDIDSAPPFANFHSMKPSAHDYKLRHALKGTPLWGAYLTDAIKNFPELSSSKVMRHLKQNPGLAEANISSLEREIDRITDLDAIIFALGGACYNLLNKYLSSNLRIIKLPHYSQYISKEKYRDIIVGVLAEEGIFEAS